MDAPKDWVVIGTILLSGCAYGDRIGEPLSLGEALEVAEVAGRYQELFPTSQECLDFLGEARVVVADRHTMLDLCWRDEPGRCAAGESLSQYGCAAGCYIARSRCPSGLFGDCEVTATIVSSELNSAEDHLSVVRHEAVHALGHCHRNYLTTQHSEPFYYLADGT
jgi:hypothetical protein